MIELILIKGKNIVKIWDNRNWEEKNSERVKCYIRLLSGISLYKMCFFNKKKKMNEMAVNIEELKRNIYLINKSKMILFDTAQKSKKLLLDGLRTLDGQRKHYSPIVEVGKTSVYYFPQLNYSHIGLLKNIFQELFVGENFTIRLGKEIV